MSQAWKHPQKNGPSSKGVHFYQDLSQKDFLASNVDIEWTI